MEPKCLLAAYVVPQIVAAGLSSSPLPGPRNAGRHDATLRFVAESSIHRERFATEAKRLCDVGALAGEVGDAVSVVRETQLNSEFAFASPEAAMGTIMLPQPASQPRPHAWMRSNPTYTRRGNIATTAAASQGDSSTASATGRGSHVRSVETAATTVDTGDWSVRGRRRRRTNTMPSPTSARMAAAPATRSRLHKARFWRAPSTFALGGASRLGSTPVNDGC